MNFFEFRALNEKRPTDINDRIDVRVYGHFPAMMLLATENQTIKCAAINISAGGAALECSARPPLKSVAVLYIEGFGRFNSETAWFRPNELGVKFSCHDAKRLRLSKNIEHYKATGNIPDSATRAHLRTRSVSEGYFETQDGNLVRCDVLDFSLKGLSLASTQRPAIGELIKLGGSSGRVVRYHSEGFAVEFISVAAG